MLKENEMRFTQNFAGWNSVLRTSSDRRLLHNSKAISLKWHSSPHSGFMVRFWGCPLALKYSSV